MDSTGLCIDGATAARVTNKLTVHLVDVLNWLNHMNYRQKSFVAPAVAGDEMYMSGFGNTAKMIVA